MKLVVVLLHCVLLIHDQKTVVFTLWYVFYLIKSFVFCYSEIQIAKNPQGHVQISAQVDVQESPGIDETSYVQPDAFKYIEKQPVGPRPAKVRRESDTSNLQQKPAKIVKTPISTSIVEGETAQFTCQVEGHPKPKVKKNKTT